MTDNGSIRIGSGSKLVDGISLLISLLLFLLLLIYYFFDNEVILLMEIFGIGLIFNVIRVLNRNYLTISNGQFMVDNLLKKRRQINCQLYKSVSQDPFNIAFSNVIKVNLNNGEYFRISGGLENVIQLDLKIKSIINK